MNDHPFRHDDHARPEEDVLREGLGHRILGVHGRSVFHPAYGSSRLSRVHLPLQTRRFPGNISFLRLGLLNFLGQNFRIFHF